MSRKTLSVIFGTVLHPRLLLCLFGDVHGKVTMAGYIFGFLCFEHKRSSSGRHPACPSLNGLVHEKPLKAIVRALQTPYVVDLYHCYLLVARGKPGRVPSISALLCDYYRRHPLPSVLLLTFARALRRWACHQRTESFVVVIIRQHCNTVAGTN
ncbi:hypothetical protein C8J56DRAFT_920205 [Mycena floridula]|nr:hypothetical protein C8J56DRAFT_920205 [Mycena floridula]